MRLNLFEIIIRDSYSGIQILVFFNYSHVNIQYIFDAFIHERVTDKVVIEELDNSMSLSDEYTISLYKDREYVYIPTRHSNNKHEASSNVM